MITAHHSSPSNFTRSILNINSNRIRNKWSSPVCAIDSPFPFSDRAIPIIVTAVERDNVDSETELWSSRVPSFRLSYRSVKRVQPRFEREFAFQTRWNIHQSCSIFRTNPARRSLLTVFYLVKVIVIWNNE